MNRVTFSISDCDRVLRDVQTSTGWDDHQTRRAVAAVAQVNLELVETLLQACGDASEIPSVTVLGAAARVQRSILNGFA